MGSELELGKCGEYYAIFTLAKQGFVAYPSDQGLPYDVVVDVNGRLLRGQVKSTMGRRDYGRMKDVYRWGTRSSKGANRPASADRSDFYAFVSISDEKIAFMATSEILSAKNNGTVCQSVEMRSRTQKMVTRTYSTGKVRIFDKAKMVEDFAIFSRAVDIIMRTKK
ncbi:hypothetical protein I6G37_09780 [Serratia rubidaea]|uniref:group I intron-associated PD-(D/E)XK endonuclease n=1 Tax=Serratia rubidaea TaxID=61652 RepID=UPI0018D87D4E|nr:group I intron-associated PD-(D/E)XK endonuclease [Serratia rubidaea]MCR0998694.1 group I intron-associated PD-(D/E)XK endonuclease [Serratia rubidaea]QPT15203.1 hypothetical protein I6G37_09780 [Serratia rubidaea]